MFFLMSFFSQSSSFVLNTFMNLFAEVLDNIDEINLRYFPCAVWLERRKRFLKGRSIYPLHLFIYFNDFMFVPNKIGHTICFI